MRNSNICDFPSCFLLLQAGRSPGIISVAADLTHSPINFKPVDYMNILSARCIIRSSIGPLIVLLHMHRTVILYIEEIEEGKRKLD